MSLATFTNLTAGKLGCSKPSFLLNATGSPGDSKTMEVSAADLIDNAELNSLLKAPAKITVVVADDPNLADQLEEMTRSGAGADDALVVHKSGAENITGVKTFTVAPLVPVPGAAGNPVRNDDARNTNARTPTAHAASHMGGGDAISTLPTADQKAALAGTNGAPAAANKFVTDTDPRNSDARTTVEPVPYTAAGGIGVVWVAGLPVTTTAALDRIAAAVAGLLAPGGIP